MLNDRITTRPVEGVTAVIYTDNQSVLHTLRKMEAKSGQSHTRFIIQTANLLRTKGVQVVFRWIPGHNKIKGNEIADQAAKKATTDQNQRETPGTRYLSAVYGLVDRQTHHQWTERWTKGTQGSHTRTLSPEPSQAIRKLHAGLQKAESAILTQLRTGKIGFNKFLFDRSVPTVLSPQCACEQGMMTVRHVLLSCTLWTEKRQQELRPLRTTDLRQILGTPAGSRPAIRFILQTGLLAQFDLFAREEQARRGGGGEL